MRRRKEIAHCHLGSLKDCRKQQSQVQGYLGFQNQSNLTATFTKMKKNRNAILTLTWSHCVLFSRHSSLILTHLSPLDQLSQREPTWSPDWRNEYMLQLQVTTINSLLGIKTKWHIHVAEHQTLQSQDCHSLAEWCAFIHTAITLTLWKCDPTNEGWWGWFFFSFKVCYNLFSKWNTGCRQTERIALYHFLL